VAQNHGDWCAAHGAATAFLLDPCDRRAPKAMVSAGDQRSPCAALFYETRLKQIRRSNWRRRRTSFSRAKAATALSAS